VTTGVFDDGRPGRGGLADGWEQLSGKFALVAEMLEILWKRTRDKIVIVSNYTQTLDLITTLCRAQDYPFVRLDGSTSINKRQKLVRSSAGLYPLYDRLHTAALACAQYVCATRPCRPSLARCREVESQNAA
jgi:hypothetical protein